MTLRGTGPGLGVSGWLCVPCHLLWRGRERPTGQVTASDLKLHSVFQTFECSLVMVMNYEGRSSIDFFLLPESLDPCSLTLAFPSQPLYSSQAPPTFVLFFVFIIGFIGRNIFKASFIHG